MPNEKLDLSVFEQAGLTQGEAADVIGIARLTYIRWLKGFPMSDAMQRKVNTAIVLVKVAMKLGKLPDSLPPSRLHKETRRHLIDTALAEARVKLDELRAKRKSS